MVPKEYQDMVLQNGVMMKEGDVGCETIRDNLVNVANQRIQMVRPVPMDVGCLDGNLGGMMVGMMVEKGGRRCATPATGGAAVNAKTALTLMS